MTQSLFSFSCRYVLRSESTYWWMMSTRGDAILEYTYYRREGEDEESFGSKAPMSLQARHEGSKEIMAEFVRGNGTSTQET